MGFLEARMCVALAAGFAAGALGGAAVVAERHALLRPCLRLVLFVAARAPAAVGALVATGRAAAGDGTRRAADTAAGCFFLRVTAGGRREFRYGAHGREYVVSCAPDKAERRPSHVVCATATGKDGSSWDVTKEIEERLGPQGDCHGMAEGISVDWIDGAETLCMETLEDEVTLTRSDGSRSLTS